MEQNLKEIESSIIKSKQDKKKRLKQMKIIVITLWIISLIGIFFQLNLHNLKNPPQFIYVIIMIAPYILLVAIIATVIYILRKYIYQGSSKEEEILLSLKNIEQMLQEQQKKNE